MHFLLNKDTFLSAEMFPKLYGLVQLCRAHKVFVLAEPSYSRALAGKFCDKLLKTSWDHYSTAFFMSLFLLQVFSCMKMSLLEKTPFLPTSVLAVSTTREMSLVPN